MGDRTPTALHLSYIAMSRYFFNSANGSRHADDEGVELKDNSVAREYAIVYAGEILDRNPTSLLDGPEFQVEVRDTHRALLFAVTVYVMAISDGRDGK